MDIFNDFSVGLFALQLVILLVLLFLLAKFAWKPILNSLDEREEGIQNALDEAANARKEMQNLQADNQRLLKEAREERDAMMKDAREIKDKILADAKSESEVQTASMIESAKVTIKQEQNSAIAELKKKVGELSIGIAQTVVQKELATQDGHLDLIESLLKDVKLN